MGQLLAGTPSKVPIEQETLPTLIALVALVGSTYEM